MTTQMQLIIGFSTLLGVIRVMMKANLFINTLKNFKWLIFFYLLFMWLYNIVDISLIHLLLGTAAITILGIKFVNKNMLSKLLINGFYIGLIINMVMPYGSLIIQKLNPYVHLFLN